jgi:hypothetical protein
VARGGRTKTETELTVSTTTISPTQKTEQQAELRRQIAEARQQWAEAMNLYSSAIAAANRYLGEAIRAGEQVDTLRSELGWLGGNDDDSN